MDSLLCGSSGLPDGSIGSYRTVVVTTPVAAHATRFVIVVGLAIVAVMAGFVVVVVPVVAVVAVVVGVTHIRARSLRARCM